MTEPMDSARLRELIDIVLDEFQAVATRATRDVSAIEELAVLAYLRETFIAGGVERVQAVHNAERWLQIGIRFASAKTHLEFLEASALAARTREWLAADRVQHMYLVNKSPGIRLRFCGPSIETEWRDQVVAFLEQEKRAGRLSDYEFGVYDEETHQFGGSLGLSIFHRFSTGDSLAILDLYALLARRPDALDDMLFSLAVLSDLARKVSDEGWEQWDLWCNLRLARRGIDPRGPLASSARQALQANRELLELVVFRPDEFLAGLDDDARAIVRACYENNTRVADALGRAARSGSLLYGVRKIVPFYFIFHWNRLRFSKIKQMSLTLLMRALLSPKEDFGT